MTAQTIENIERAAWYARLAFGFCQESNNSIPVMPEKSDSTFYVMP